MRSPQLSHDRETRDALAPPDRVLADLRLANLAAAVANGDLLARWDLGVAAVTLCLRREGR